MCEKLEVEDLKALKDNCPELIKIIEAMDSDDLSFENVKNILRERHGDDAFEVQNLNDELEDLVIAKERAAIKYNDSEVNLSSENRNFFFFQSPNLI